MKKRFYILSLWGMIVVSSLSGCMEKELVDVTVNAPGSAIVFGTTTEWQNGVGTRTEYSGRDEENGFITVDSEYERIDWVDGMDQIRILCDAATGKATPGKKTADYLVSGVSVGSEKQKSEAGVESCDDNSLQWGTGSHYFYALYPAPGMESNYDFSYKTVAESKSKIESLSGNRAKITGEIPSSQEAVKVGREYKANMNYAYMYASATAESGGTGPVVLGFKPLFTSFEIRLKAGNAGAVGMKVKRVALTSESGASGSDLTGQFVATLQPDGTYSVTTSGVGRSISVPIASSSQQALSSDDVLKFTLLSLPVDQTGLTLTLTLDKNGEEVQRKLALRTDLNNDGKIGSGEWITVGAGKKIYISNLGVPGDIWQYTIEDVSDIIINGRAAGSGTSALRSYRTSGSTKEYVDVTFQYSTDGTTYQSGLPSGLTGLSKSAGSVAIERRLTANVGAHSIVDKITQKNEIIDHAKIMKTHATKGSASSPWDLSRHTITGVARPADAPVVTANSYVVDAAGTYMFPLVYGNSVDIYKNTSLDVFNENGGNKDAYKAPDTNSPFTQFVRFDGNPITRPYILWDVAQGSDYDNRGWWVDYDARIPRYELVVLWQDVPTDEAIITQPVTVYQYPGTNGPLGHDIIYAQFTVDPTVIDEVNYKVKGAHQGNFVIALRVAAPGGLTVNGENWPKGTILWSWHIWVTDNAMNSIQVKTNGSSVNASNYVMPYHLGWCDEKVYKITNYKTRTWYVKATQQSGESVPKSTVFKVIQKGDNIYEQIRWSNSVCYQWGRKDPFLGGYNAYTGVSYSSAFPEEYAPYNKQWSSPSGYNIAGTSEGLVAVNPSNMTISAMIRTPYIFRPNDITYKNAWNANATESDGVETRVVKTVYDPCPPNFSLPHKWAFSNFSKKGTNASLGVLSLSDTNAKDVTGDGALTAADFSQEDGWYFYTGYGSNTIYFPGTCGRYAGEDHMSHVRYFHCAYVWTAAYDYNYGPGGTDLYYSSDGASPYWVSGTVNALTVRPVSD